METESRICYSPESMWARELEFKAKFGPNAEIYDPENVNKAIVQDVILKVNSYKKQIDSSTNFVEKIILRKRRNEAISQVCRAAIKA